MIINQVFYKEDKNPSHNLELTPLHNAAFKGHLDICELFLEHMDSENPMDNNGITPLHRAAKNGWYEKVKLILDNLAIGENNPSSYNGTTPFHNAAYIYITL